MFVMNGQNLLKQWADRPHCRACNKSEAYQQFGCIRTYTECLHFESLRGGSHGFKESVGLRQSHLARSPPNRLPNLEVSGDRTSRITLAN